MQQIDVSIYMPGRYICPGNYRQVLATTNGAFFTKNIIFVISYHKDQYPFEQSNSTKLRSSNIPNDIIFNKYYTEDV